MKNLTLATNIIVLSGFILLSCENDPFTEAGNNPENITVQFEATTKEVAENGEAQIVMLNFNKPAEANGVITIKTSNQFDVTIHTVPAAENGLIRIQVVKGDVSALIKLQPIDNSGKDGHKELNLTLYQLAAPFIAGLNNSLNITVKDDETSWENLESTANFLAQDIILEETNTTGAEYQIQLSELVAVNSEIKINISSEKGIYNSDYVTEPPAENNMITLLVSAGASMTSFKVKAVDNSQITGELQINFTLAETSGSIRIGDKLHQAITIKDDELAQKPKGYEITQGTDVAKKFFEYDSLGRVSKVKWETYTPYYAHGTETYYYDANSRLIKINKHANQDVLYQWSNSTIVKSTEMTNGKIGNYTDYEYDEAGNITGVVTYHLQGDGSFVKGFFTVYLYFTDGDLYKSLTYQDSGDPGSPLLISTKSYENYLGVSCPFPMTEVLPVIKSQKHLATTYRVEENGVDLTYKLTYEYRADGLPSKRIATAKGDIQTAVYYYY